MRWVKYLAVLVLLLTLGFGVGVTRTFAEPPDPQGEVDGDKVSVGDTVALAARQGNDCEFASTKVRTTVSKDGKPRWLAIQVDENCEARVNAKWEGALTDGPHDVTDPLIRKLSMTSPGVLEKLKSSMTSVAPSSALNSYKVSQQYVWMYGYGGTGDVLTQQDGAIGWSYDGTWATLNSHPYNCVGSPEPYWRWVVDWCGETDIQYGPASQVWHTVRGNYHCDPANQLPCSLGSGYYHSLYNAEYGRGDGSSACYFWYSGTIVAGETRQIIQGCQ
jgi:hypothetical protein